MEMLENKIKSIANKYADLIERRIETAINEGTDSTAMCEINDGIRMLNHITSTLERIKRLQGPLQTLNPDYPGN